MPEFGPLPTPTHVSARLRDLPLASCCDIPVRVSSRPLGRCFERRADPRKALWHQDAEIDGNHPVWEGGGFVSLGMRLPSTTASDGADGGEWSHPARQSSSGHGARGGGGGRYSLKGSTTQGRRGGARRP